MNTFYSFVTKGFIVESIVRYVKPDRTSYPCRLYRLPVSQEVYDRIKTVLEYFVDFRGLLHYSKLGLALSLLHIPYRRSRFGFFCSQFVAHVLELGGAVTLEKKEHRYFSEDLGRLPGMQLQFCGDLRGFVRRFALEASV